MCSDVTSKTVNVTCMVMEHLYLALMRKQSLLHVLWDPGKQSEPHVCLSVYVFYTLEYLKN